MATVPIKKIEAPRFVNVHRHYEQPGYDSQEKRQSRERKNYDNENLNTNIKSVRRNKEGDLIIELENGRKCCYKNGEEKTSRMETMLDSSNYGTHFDFRA